MLAAETTGHKDIGKSSASRALEDSRRALAAQLKMGNRYILFHMPIIGGNRGHVSTE